MLNLPKQFLEPHNYHPILILENLVTRYILQAVCKDVVAPFYFIMYTDFIGKNEYFSYTLGDDFADVHRIIITVEFYETISVDSST